MLIHGVTRKSGCGLPDHIIQDKVTISLDVEKLRNAVKAGVLKGDQKCPGLVAVSVYDNNPVHFLSMVCDRIDWIIKSQPVYNNTISKVPKMKFLQLNVNEI